MEEVCADVRAKVHETKPEDPQARPQHEEGFDNGIFEEGRIDNEKCHPLPIKCRRRRWGVRR